VPKLSAHRAYQAAGYKIGTEQLIIVSRLNRLKHNNGVKSS